MGQSLENTGALIQLAPQVAGQESTAHGSPSATYHLTPGQLDGALLELNRRGLGLALLVDSEGGATVCELDVPVEYEVAS